MKKIIGYVIFWYLVAVFGILVFRSEPWGFYQGESFLGKDKKESVEVEENGTEEVKVEKEELHLDFVVNEIEDWDAEERYEFRERVLFFEKKKRRKVWGIKG